MLRHVLRAYRWLLSETVRASRSRSRANLEVAALEERATPDATPILTMPTSIQVLVAPAVPSAALAPTVNLSIPMAGQSSVRLDLIAPGEGPPSEYADNGGDPIDHVAKTPPEAPAAPPSNTISDEELTAMLEAAAQEASWVAADDIAYNFGVVWTELETAVPAAPTVILRVNDATRAHSLEVFNTPVGLEINKAILAGTTYARVPFITDVKSIIDVGANIGAASVYFALTYPEARIYAFEPYPQAYELLCRNVASLGQVRAFEFGLFDRDCRAPLYLSKVDSVTNSIRASRLNSDQHVEIPLRQAREALHALQIDAIDILKIDTEGCELPILLSLSELAHKARVIYLEYHDDADRIAMDAFLTDTHILLGASVTHAHRGRLCYVAQRAFPAGEVEPLRIRSETSPWQPTRNDSPAAQKFRHAIGLLGTVHEKLLLNRDFLVSTIRAAGIRDIGPYDEYAERDGSLLQDPQQFADALLCLAKYRVRTMLEVGTFRGFTACVMTAFLRRFNADLQTLCIDPLRIDRDAFGLPIQWQVGTSDDLAGRKFDLAFIDGDHTYPWVKRDYANVGVHAPVCMFHDIDDGDHNFYDPGTFWLQLKQVEAGHDFFEFKHPTRHHMGIGIRVKQGYR